MRIARAFFALFLLSPLALIPSATARSPRPAHGSEKSPGCIEKEWGFRCFYGPYTASYDPDEEHSEATYITPPPAAGYITSAYATLVDENGDWVSRHEAHLHHVVFGNPNKPNLMCPNLPVDTFFASGKERTTMVMPEGYGYYWDNESPGYGYPPTWAIVHHVMTMHEGHETEVFVRLDLHFQQVPEGSLIDVKSVWLDVMGCSQDPVFDVVKGSGEDGVYKQVNTMTIPEDGQLVALGGHLHDGGLKLRLDNMTTGAKVWASRPTYGSAHHGWDLRKMTSYSGAPGLQVTAGDTLQLTASYDSTHSWNKVMGIMVGALAPSVLDGPYRLP